MESKAKRRANIRKESCVDVNLRVSLQTLSPSETLDAFELKISSCKNEYHRKELYALTRVLEELLLPTVDIGSQRGFIDFEFGFETFSSFFTKRPNRVGFRDHLLDRHHGIPVLINPKKILLARFARSRWNIHSSCSRCNAPC